MAASPTLITPTPKPKTLFHSSIKSKLTPQTTTTISAASLSLRRRDLIGSAIAAAVLVLRPSPSLAAAEDEYIKETVEVINKIRSTITMEKSDPNVANAVTELRDSSNAWVAKYRREKALLGRASFRDIYSALNAVSGHYISFGPTAQIPAKRRARILEEMDTAEKALLRGR